MHYVVWGLVVLLIVIHQDFWFWDKTTLVFGFMPIGLLYHFGISLAAAFTWFLATMFCWPADLEEETLAAVADAPSGDSAHPTTSKEGATE
ncbi:MAG: DUF3311 domain-containing protein [Planctomycetaceae bacterium]|nr:DUF3311 domain-containing protein [Planctomycetaceae bacterium]MCB1078326.1 DUF3311 domain-containing protein [Verrucomicrobiae bacterium]